MTGFALSFAGHVSLYPVLLLPPLVLLLQQSSHLQEKEKHGEKEEEGKIAFFDQAAWAIAAKLVAALVAHQVLLLGASRALLGSWDFLDNVYGVM